jgi:hypothetical protein
MLSITRMQASTPAGMGSESSLERAKFSSKTKNAHSTFEVSSLFLSIALTVTVPFPSLEKVIDRVRSAPDPVSWTPEERRALFSFSVL